MRDEHGVPIEPAEELCYLRIPTNKMRGEFYVPVPAYVADAIEVWESVRPPNQGTLLDRKTHKPTQYLFQYRNDLLGEKFLNGSVIPLLCKLAGVSQTDVRPADYLASGTRYYGHLDAQNGHGSSRYRQTLRTYRSPPVEAQVSSGR